MTSTQFDAYLLLFDTQGQQIAKDDDSAGGNNARIVVKLPTTGTYTAVAISARAGETGAYELRIRTGTQPELAMAEAKTEADRLLQQGNQQFQVSQYEAAMQSWEVGTQALPRDQRPQGRRCCTGQYGQCLQ